MNAQECTIDFETKEIEGRPVYPPEPVGVSIIEPNKKPVYMAWAHPIENNCSKAQAKRKLKEVYSKYTIIAHNAKFDLEIGEKFFGLPLIPKHGFHCTMILAFLYNPRSYSLKLKLLAEKYLGMKPNAQDKLHDWLVTNVPAARKAKSKWGAYISLAPAKLVGKYANDDTLMTKRLKKLFYKKVKAEGMLEQYEIEKLAAIKSIKLERVGVSIDYKELEPDLVKAKKTLKRYENKVFKKIGYINLNSPKQIIDTFTKKKLVKKWEYGERTKTGQINPKTGIDSLLRVCTDKQLVHDLDYYSKYTKLIGTYMQPWLDSALENDGKFFMWYNTIRGDNDKGTYTGRFSSNFQQVPRKPKEIYKGMPFLRNYVIADTKKQVLLKRDFMSQEIRILAHFEDGTLLAAYNKNPLLDGHDFVQEAMFRNTGIKYERIAVKGCNFLIVYGGGVKALAKNLKISKEKAGEIFGAHGEALPDVKEVKDELKRMARHDEEFVTAGGRVYTFEDGKEYVALNTLIQGSAADHSKRSYINIDDMLVKKYPEARIVLTIHDEFILSAPKKIKIAVMKDFKIAMERDKLFSLPMLTDGAIGTHWGMMKEVA